MKNIEVLLFACCCLLALAYAQRPPLKPYPEVFTAIYNVTELGVPSRMVTFYLDVPNKRARVVSPYGPNSGDYFLIFRPPGADPTSWYGQNYTQIVVNPPYPYNTTKCTYQKADEQGPWPNTWTQAGNGQVRTIEEVSDFFIEPYNIKYAGPYFVEELGRMTDRWDSTNMCKSSKSIFGYIPCKSMMFTRTANPLPVMDIQAGQTGDSEETYIVRVYHSFNTSVSDSDFELPDQWQKRCANLDADYILSPSATIEVYSDGTSETDATISLAVAPIRELGPVTVVFKAYPYDEYSCVDCVTVDKKLTFTADNWNVPQVVPFTYHKPGCSNMRVQAIGGGYHWTPRPVDWIVYTCKGSADKGCYSPLQC